MSFRVEAIEAGGVARANLRAADRATVFAAFERSCYVETPAGIACVGGAGLGCGPLNVTVREFAFFPAGSSIRIDFATARQWRPQEPSGQRFSVPARISASWRNHPEAQAFLRWIAGSGLPDDALIGLGPGLTPAGDDFAGGAMIALRAFGHARHADRIAAWALPLAKRRTNRISRAHLECAAAGQGHEALHRLLAALGRGDAVLASAVQALDRVGHSSGRDAAAGALLSLAAAADANSSVA